MAAKRNWLPGRLVVIAAAAVVMIVPSMTCQRGSGGIKESDESRFEIYRGGITREPATMVQISIAHTCELDDELILEKVEICGEAGVSVKSLAANKTLNSYQGN